MLKGTGPLPRGVGSGQHQNYFLSTEVCRRRTNHLRTMYTMTLNSGCFTAELISQKFFSRGSQVTLTFKLSLLTVHLKTFCVKHVEDTKRKTLNDGFAASIKYQTVFCCLLVLFLSILGDNFFSLCWLMFPQNPGDADCQLSQYAILPGFLCHRRICLDLHSLHYRHCTGSNRLHTTQTSWSQDMQSTCLRTNRPSK